MDLVLRGPDGARVICSSSEVFPDDPGMGTPSLVRWGKYSGTFNICLNMGMIDWDCVPLTPEILEWLSSIQDRVMLWEREAFNKARNAK